MFQIYTYFFCNCYAIIIRQFMKIRQNIKAKEMFCEHLGKCYISVMEWWVQ